MKRRELLQIAPAGAAAWSAAEMLGAAEPRSIDWGPCDSPKVKTYIIAAVEGT
jgi:hypothetical protein